MTLTLINYYYIKIKFLDIYKFIINKKKKRNIYFFYFAVVDHSWTGFRVVKFRPGTDTGQLRFRLFAVFRIDHVHFPVQGHGTRPKALPLHCRPVPGIGEPIRRGRRWTSIGRLWFGQPDSSISDDPPCRRPQAGQGHVDHFGTVAPSHFRPCRRGRDRIRCLGNGVRRWRKRQRSSSGRWRVHRRRFEGNK